ncbi:hypothetical protein Tco_0989661 [Tanacetum coccineum]|uniref:Uncharacterized protein n=1 Tax=Tanacetum coccineum TaxID=301880 RepID=A0ABQ5EVN3_9ASTR
MSIATARSIEDFEAQQVVKKVDEHLMDEDIKKIVEGYEESDANKFVNDILNGQEDPDTRIEPESHKESSEAEKSADFMTIDGEVKEESAEDALLRKKGKELKELMAFEPTSSSPKPKTSRSKHIKGEIARMSRRYGLIFRHIKKSFMPRNDMDVIGQTLKESGWKGKKVKADIASMVAKAVRKEQEHTRAELSLQVTNDVVANVPPYVDAFLRNYMNNHILHVHLTESVSSTIPDLQQQLYLKIKDDDQAHDVDLPIWLALKYKYEKYARHVEPYRVDAFRSRYHEDHQDDDARPEGESSAKRQRTFEHGMYTRGTDDDEVPSEEVSPELLAEVSGKGITTDDPQRMQDALNDMMKRRYVIRVQYDQGYEQEYMEGIVVKRADDPALSNDDAEFMRFYEEYIQECLRHRDQMRRWESYVNERPLVQRWDHPK